jgi:4-amino-4-deoxy-L-arabinose transferase-like glycosyltransferase
MAIVVLALGVRMGYVAATPGYHPHHDDQKFDALAVAVSRTGAYPDVGGASTAYRPPGFTYFLAGVYAVSGTGRHRIANAREAQAALGVLLVALIGLVGLQLFGTGAALWSMGLAAVYPPLVTAGTSLLSEPLAAVLLVGAIASVLAWRQRHHWWLVVLAGVLAGLLTLTRSNGIVAVPGLAIGLWPGRPRLSWRSLAAPAAMLGLALAVVIPWTVRNAVVMRAFIPVSDEAGTTLAGTYNAVSDHYRPAPASWLLLNDIPSYDAQTRHLVHGPEAKREAHLLSLAMGYIEAHPLYPAKVAFYNTARMFDLGGMKRSRFTATLAGIDSRRVARLGVEGAWALSALALLGACLRDVRRRVPGFVWLTYGLLFASIVLVNVETPRFRLVLDTFLVLLAGAALADVITQLRPRSHEPEPVAPSVSTEAASADSVSPTASANSTEASAGSTAG